MADYSTTLTENSLNFQMRLPWIDSYVVFLPLLVLLDKDPASLTDVELQQIHNVRASRTVDAIVTVEYAGAIHRLNISLIFQ
jgi:hypothetical protein